MKPLQQILAEADQQNVAVGHFNISDLVALKAVYLAAREVNVPVIVGVSEGERDFIGVQQIAALVRSIREQNGFPIYLNADHTHSIEKAREAAQAGFDSVVFDGSALPFEENVAKTKQAVTEMKAIHPSIVVEGELGFIGSSSSIHDKIPEGMSPMTTPEQASEFVRRTGVDVLAPAVGTMHGMLKSMVAGETKKHVDPARIAAIKRATRKPLTLHGGSGTVSAISGSSINLNNGLFLSGSGAVYLGGGNLTVNDLASGISSGTIYTVNQYVGFASNGLFSQTGGLTHVGSVYVGCAWA